MSRVEALEQVLEELRLSNEEKSELARWLQRERIKEWSRLFAVIDRRRKGRRIPIEAIVREVKAYRRERSSE